MENTTVQQKPQDYTAYVLGIGVINILSGKTCYDWSIYDQPDAKVFLTNQSTLLFGAPYTFDGLGDDFTITYRGNDTQRKLAERIRIVDSSFCVKEEVLAMLKKNGYDYYPIRAFRARAKNNRQLKTSHSIKGLTETTNVK